MDYSDEDDIGGGVSDGRSASPSLSERSTDSKKKLMLKYMLHEVRALKHSIDPSLPDFHVRPKRGRGAAHSASTEQLLDQFNTSQDLDGFDVDELDDGANRDEMRPRRRHLPTTPAPAGDDEPGRAEDSRQRFSLDQRDRLMALLKE